MSKLLKLLREQRKLFMRTVDGKRLITDHKRYVEIDDALEAEQKRIGWHNKRAIKAECRERGIPLPDFKREAEYVSFIIK